MISSFSYLFFLLVLICFLNVEAFTIRQRKFFNNKLPPSTLITLTSRRTKIYPILKPSVCSATSERETDLVVLDTKTPTQGLEGKNHNDSNLITVASSGQQSLASNNSRPQMSTSTSEDLEPENETSKLLKQVKEAGIAGVISYAAWELAFWFVSIPVVLFGYFEFTGHWPNLSDGEDIAKLSAEAFAFVNFARFAVPLRIGLALSTTPWIQANIVDRFMTSNENTDEENK